MRAVVRESPSTICSISGDAGGGSVSSPGSSSAR